MRMMKTSRGAIISLSVLLLLILGQSCAFPSLTSIQDLTREYTLRDHLPTHSLTLLHWFANIVTIDNNNVVRVPFDPRADFGSHHYGNYERMLPIVRPGNQYYTVGNLNNRQTCPVLRPFPEYVHRPRVQDFATIGPNSDRIVFQVDNSRRVHEMFLTQHLQTNSWDSSYDPENTFIVTHNLLQEIREFSTSNNQQSLQALRDRYNQNINDDQLHNLINIWGRNQAPLGLLHAIVVPQRMNMGGQCTRNTPRSYEREKRGLASEAPAESNLPVNVIREKHSVFQSERTNCEIQQIDMEVVTGDKGKARILWGKVNWDKLHSGVAVALFKTKKHQGELTFEKIETEKGSWDTSEDLNDGLQARLHKVEDSGIFFTSWTLKEEICSGEEFVSPPDVSVTGHAYAQLQLYVRDGKACFRFYVREGCGQWESDFKEAWVALYESAETDTYDYMFWKWQYVRKFTKDLDIDVYNTFTYCTGTRVRQGIEARLILNDLVKARAAWP